MLYNKKLIELTATSPTSRASGRVLLETTTARTKTFVSIKGVAPVYTYTVVLETNIGYLLLGLIETNKRGHGTLKVNNLNTIQNASFISEIYQVAVLDDTTTTAILTCQANFKINNRAVTPVPLRADDPSMDPIAPPLQKEPRIIGISPNPIIPPNPTPITPTVPPLRPVNPTPITPTVPPIRPVNPMPITPVVPPRPPVPNRPNRPLRPQRPQRPNRPIFRPKPITPVVPPIPRPIPITPLNNDETQDDNLL